METVPILFLSFVSYSFFGWCCECAYCSTLQKKWVNRGFLNGPLCPVYGFGAMAVVALLSGIREQAWLVFLCGLLVASAIEYVCGWLLETLFHARWWDYSSYRFQLHGRVCLRNSLMFGALSVVAVCWIDPILTALLLRIPQKIQCFLSGALLSLMFADMVLTTKEVLALDGKLSELEAIAEEAELRLRLYRSRWKEQMAEYRADWSDDLEERIRHLELRLAGLIPEQEEGRGRERLSELLPEREELGQAFRLALERVEARLDVWEARKSAGERRLLEAFPNFRSHRHPEAVAKLKEWRKKRKENGKRS